MNKAREEYDATLRYCLEHLLFIDFLRYWNHNSIL